MSTPITISIPHQLGRVEARRRIEEGFSKMVTLVPGSGGPSTKSWDGDRLTFRFTAMGQTVSGVIEVFDATVNMNIDLPGLLGTIAGTFKSRLAKAGQRLLTKS